MTPTLVVPASRRAPASLGWRTVGLILAVVLTLSALAVMSVDVLRKLDDQATASSDNIQWTLSQVEVEYRRLEVALARAESGSAADLAELRQRFDVFYGRIATMRTGGAYLAMRDLPQASNPASVQAALDRAIPAIDASDEVLAAALPELSPRLQALGPSVRDMAVTANGTFAVLADASRGAVHATLFRVAATTLVLIVALIGMLGWAIRMLREARELAEAAHEASTRYSAILSSSIDAVLAADSSGNILEFNSAAVRMFGHAREQVLGSDIAGLIEPSELRDTIIAAMARVATTGEAGTLPEGRITGRARRRDGSTFPVEVSVATAMQGRDTIFVAFLTDITARLEAEAELTRARDDALAGEKAKADLLAVMSHEMRTPLNGLLGTMELMRDSVLDTAQRDQLRIMETSGQLLLSHVNDVLDISRIDAGKVEISHEAFEIGTLLHEVVDGQRSLAQANGNTLSVALDPALPAHLAGDPGRLRQILLNLVGNAVKFTRDGAITIEAERVAGGLVELRVIDTGVGMSERDLARIFEDFVTLDTSYARTTGGTGLGLGIVQRLVRAMGGEIGAESEPGEGSLFWLRLELPHAEMPGRPTAGPDPATAIPVPPCNVLVVEDNEINRQVVGEMLRRGGHSVSFAFDGEAGVAAAESEKVQLILMDISMPRMDGVAAARAIRGGTGPNRATPIVALTAHALPDDIARFHAAGMERVLTKPLSRAALHRLLVDLQPAALAPPAPPPAAAEAAPTSAPAERPAPAAELPLVDTEICDAFHEDLGHDRAAELLSSFIEQTGSVIDRLTQEADTAAADTIVAEMHRIAGAAGLFGALALSDKLRGLETLGKTGKDTELRTGLAALAPLWADTKAALPRRDRTAA